MKIKGRSVRAALIFYTLFEFFYFLHYLAGLFIAVCRSLPYSGDDNTSEQTEYHSYKEH